VLVVRVGIVSWNTAALLDRCLAALPLALAGVSAEIVVVDNASADASAQVAAAHPGVRVIANPTNVGYGRAMNQALGGTDAPVLIALNPDTEPPPGSLAALASRLMADPGVGLVAPQLVGADGVVQYTARHFPGLAVAAAGCLLPVRRHDGRLGRRLLLEAAAQPVRPADVDWAIGAVHVIRASALRGRKPYDERWFMYVEDIELCWWLAQRGWRRRFQPDITVPHVGNASGAQAWGDDYDRRCYDAIYDWYQRDVGARPLRVVAALNAVNAASRAAVGRLARRPADHIANRAHAARYHAHIARYGPPPPAGAPGKGPSTIGRL
jgi:N-acetylglucosaminyl-diphospho-decaprenol L-rhamnosyltransferase